MKVVILATVAASMTLGVDAFLNGGSSTTTAGKSKGQGGAGGSGGSGRSGDSVAGPGGAGGQIGGRISANSGAGGSGGSVGTSLGSYQQGPQVFYGPTSGPVGNSIGGGNANGASSGNVKANPNYAGANASGGGSGAKTGKTTGGQGASGGSTGNVMSGSQSGPGGSGPNFSPTFSPTLAAPPIPMRRRALVSGDIQDGLRRRHLASFLARHESELPPIDLQARDPEPQYDYDNVLFSRDAEPAAYYGMDYAFYKRSADAQPDYFEADLSLYPRDLGYDGLDLQMRGLRNEDGWFDIYAREASEFEGVY